MIKQLQTERLILTVCPPQAARVVSGGRRQLESLLGARLADHLLTPEFQGLLSYYGTMLEQDPAQWGWGLWLMTLRAGSVIFGSIGYKGKPNADGMIEIGYGIAEAYRRQGYTSEAARALIDWAFSQPAVKRITAECLTDNVASIRVLEKLGMRRTGEINGYLKWELTR